MRSRVWTEFNGRLQKEREKPVQRIEPSDLTGVSETLLIPLRYRVLASKSLSEGFKDEVGESFHDAIAYDWEKFSDGSLPGRMMLARTAIFDAEVATFLDKAPDGLVVNLGAGLDTRFHRLDNGAVRWVEIDLPNVIAFRQKLGEPKNERHRLVAASVLDEDWIAEVAPGATRPVLFVAEGLFPYFTEDEHRKIFAMLADNFPGQEMLFQTSAPSLIQEFARHSLLSKMNTNVEMRWGLEDSAEVAGLNPKVEFVREFPLLEEAYDLAPEPIRRKLSREMARKAAKIVHVRFRK
jgi:O-methyltransferase involved in polyketide biosynthesis